MYWFGGYADGKLGPINMKADFVMDYGTVKTPGRPPRVRDVNYQGWAARLALVFPWEMFEFGLQGMYATGSDLDHTSANGLPGDRVANANRAAIGAVTTKVGSYVIPPGSEETSAFGENGVGIYYSQPLLGRVPSFNQDNTTPDVPRGHRRNLVRQAHGSYKWTPWYKMTLLGSYIGDTTKHGNTIGNAVTPSGNRFRDDKTIGWEVALWNEIQIYKNLTWGVVGAWLFAGDAFDQVNRAHRHQQKPEGSLPRGFDPEVHLVKTSTPPFPSGEGGFFVPSSRPGGSAFPGIVT